MDREETRQGSRAESGWGWEGAASGGMFALRWGGWKEPIIGMLGDKSLSQREQHVGWL